MSKEKDYKKDLAEIRSMMERSSKFLSLSGWAGIMAGFYALVGIWVAFNWLNFNPAEVYYNAPNLLGVILLAVVVLILSLVTAFYFSWKKSNERGEKAWNATSRRLLMHMAVPLVSGGILILFLMIKGLIGLILPFTLLFYGIALYNAGINTIFEVKLMGIIQIFLGLISVLLIPFSILFWALGFGVVHIVYGIYMHFRYESGSSGEKQ